MRFKYTKEVDGTILFGERNNGKLTGYGINVYKDGTIYVGNWHNGVRAPGNYILLHSDGWFKVGVLTS